MNCALLSMLASKARKDPHRPGETSTYLTAVGLEARLIEHEQGGFWTETATEDSLYHHFMKDTVPPAWRPRAAIRPQVGHSVAPSAQPSAQRPPTPGTPPKYEAL